MKAKSAFIGVLFCVLAGHAAPSPAKLYSGLERHLQSLKSLEVRYDAEGTNIAAGGVSGRLIWLRPKTFYHDTPEWTLCEIGGEQWRYLKSQNMLIREMADARERWTPEGVLFDLGKGFRPQSVDEQGDGTCLLKLTSGDGSLPGTVTLQFPPEAGVPDQIHFELADGTVTNYGITEWNENLTVDSELFTPPDVPAENVIDFRAAREGAR